MSISINDIFYKKKYYYKQLNGYKINNFYKNDSMDINRISFYLTEGKYTTVDITMVISYNKNVSKTNANSCNIQNYLN